MRISYSPNALKTFESCQRKYWHRYINETPYEAEDKKSLIIGSVLHKYCELACYNVNLLGSDYLETAKNICDTNNTLEENDLAAISAMAEKVLTWFSEGFVGMLFEADFSMNDEEKMFIDCIARSVDNNKIWIIDLKTCSAIMSNPFQQMLLYRDLQMIRYNYRALELYEKLYEGCIYLQVSKPKLKRKENESIESYTKRCQESVNINPIFLRKEMLTNEENKMRVMHLKTIIFGLTRNCSERLFETNYNSCFNYYSKCEYFDNCNKNLIMENKND
jgi:hypothetical protein